jgi:hypothetical protein
MTPFELTAAKAIGGNIFNRLYHLLFGKNHLAIDYPDWKQHAITVDIVNKKGPVAHGVRVLLTIEDSEFNLGIKDIDIQMEILSGKISAPFKSHLNPSKIMNEPICFAERDLNRRNFQTVDISPKSTRTADIMQVDLRRCYLDIASELGFSTNGGQSRALLITKKCYVGIITVESHTSKPEHFPVLFLPYAENKPLQEFGGYSFYTMLRVKGIFFGPLQWEELSEIARNCSAARSQLIAAPAESSEQEEFNIYQSREIACLAVVSRVGAGKRISALLDAMALGQIMFANLTELRKIANVLTTFEDRWNDFRPTFERTQDRRKENDEITEHLKESNWPELVLNALTPFKNRVFNGGD